MENTLVKNIDGNLLDFPEDITVICHCCNPFHTFGAGIAKSIADRYPEAYEADKKTGYGDTSKLGTVSFVGIGDEKYVVNMYAQGVISTESRAVDYEAMAKCMEWVFKVWSAKNAIIGFPKYIGCGLAGGDWRIVKAMIETYSHKYQTPAVIVNFN